jgi:hypothetical protein
VGRRLGELQSLHYDHVLPELGRHDKLLNRQRCVALLAESSYDLRENEVVSDDPRSAEFTVRVGASFSLE